MNQTIFGVDLLTLWNILTTNTYVAWFLGIVFSFVMMKLGFMNPLAFGSNSKVAKTELSAFKTIHTLLGAAHDGSGPKGLTGQLAAISALGYIRDNHLFTRQIIDEGLLSLQKSDVGKNGDSKRLLDKILGPVK